MPFKEGLSHITIGVLILLIIGGLFSSPVEPKDTVVAKLVEVTAKVESNAKAA